MTFRGLGACLRAGSALALLTIATATANAGGFAVREQSAYFQGMSFAGAAAGGDLSGMFWNPAVMTQFAGVNSSMTASWIIPYADHTPTAGNWIALGGAPNSGNEALVPSSYFSYQINANLWIGMSVNSPFGLSVNFPELWAGRDYAAGGTFLRTFNAAPSIAYRINDWISVGAGVQIQYAQASLTHGVSALIPRVGLVPAGDANLSGKGWGYGFTAGITLTPTPMTTIGIGYRSAINQKIGGNLTVPSLAGPLTFGADTTINLPDVVSLGIRQRLSPQWALLGTVEWSNWSRIGTATISGTPIVPAPILPFQYQDGWLFSVGAEYMASNRLTLRTGFGYEISPITDGVRTPLLPDNDRFWASMGASWVIGPGIAADIAYTHIFVRATPIDISATSGNPWFPTTGGITYVGSVDSHVDIVSVSVKVRLDEFLAVGKH